MTIFTILCILQTIYISNGEECRCGDAGDEHVTGNLCDYCKSDSCIDLYETPNHHHIMSLTAEDKTKAYVEHSVFHGVWECTCSNCDGLKGTWNCPGFYNNIINIESDTNDVAESFTTLLTDAQCSSYICLSPDDPCGAIDIDGFLTGCSSAFENTNNEVDGLSTNIGQNTADVATNLDKINTNIAGIGANLGNIETNTAEIASLADDIAAIQTFQGAHAGVNVVDNGVDFVDNSKYNLFLLISLLTNVFVIILACYLSIKISSKNKYHKVVSYVESDTEQPLKH